MLDDQTNEKEENRKNERGVSEGFSTTEKPTTEKASTYNNSKLLNKPISLGSGLVKEEKVDMHIDSK